MWSHISPARDADLLHLMAGADAPQRGHGRGTRRRISGTRRPTMTTNYVLVDCENVQPETLSALAEGQFKVKVFVGAAQAKGRISFELSHSMQMLGASAEYVKIARSGPNAVDMHIAYFIGRLIERERDAAIHIISKDTDFDPLLEYLRGNGVTCRRSKTI